VALAMIDACEVQLAPLDRELVRYARRQAGCRALICVFGVGALTSAAILAEGVRLSVCQGSRSPKWILNASSAELQL
jgi:transposase